VSRRVPTASGLSVTAAEVERGWVEFVCSKHGTLAVASLRCLVVCRCGRRARPTLNGTALRARDLARLSESVQKALQMKGSILRNGGSPASRAPRRPASRVDHSEAVSVPERRNCQVFLGEGGS
jgi:hypothetical protein